MNNSEMRRYFLLTFWRRLQMVWPVLVALVLIQLLLGGIVGRLEGWSRADAAYFSFVTGLTIGYGDLVPSRLAARMVALLIGLVGILLSGLVAALGVQALQETLNERARR